MMVIYSQKFFSIIFRDFWRKNLQIKELLKVSRIGDVKKVKEFLK
jgi:hypothetical protein